MNSNNTQSNESLHDMASESANHHKDTNSNKSHDNNSANQKTDAGSVEPIVIEYERPDEDLMKPPDGGWGWFIVLASFLTHLLMGGFERTSGIFYLQLRDKFGRSATETTWVTSIFATLRLFLAPLASALCNRFSCRTVTMMGTVLCTAAMIISAYAPSISFLYFSYGVLGGLGRSLTYTPSLLIVGYYFNKKRGVAVGLSTCGVGFGTFIFPPLFEFLFDNFGFEGAFLIMAAIMSNFFVSGSLSRSIEKHWEILKIDRMREQRKKRKDNLDGEEKLLNGVTSLAPKHNGLLAVQSAARMSSSMDIVANFKIESRRTSIFKRKMSQFKTVFKGDTDKKDKPPKKKLLELSLFKNFTFTCVCIQIFLFTLSFNTTFAFLPALVKEKGISKIEGAYLISILGISDGISRIVMSIILDFKKIKHYRLLVYNVVMFLAGIVSLLIPSMKTFHSFAIVGIFYGILSGTYISQKSVVVVDVLGVEKLSSSFGLLLMFQGIGMFVGPTVGGLFKDFLGSYDMAFYFGSMGIFSGGIIMAMGNVWHYRQLRKQKQLDKDKVAEESS